MGATIFKISVNLQSIFTVIVLFSSFIIVPSESSSNDYPSLFADQALQDLLDRYESIDHQNFWHPNSFNTGLQSREVIRVSGVAKHSVPGVYKQWKTAHLGPRTVFAGLTTSGIDLFDEQLRKIHSTSTPEEPVALTMFSAWNDVTSSSELVFVIATNQPSLLSYAFSNNTVEPLGAWPLSHHVKSLELCHVEFTQKLIVVPQDPKGSVDIYNFQVDGNSSQLWFFQSLKLGSRTCLVVHGSDSVCSIAYATEKRVGLATYDHHGKVFHDHPFIPSVSSPCRQLASFSLAYNEYLAYIPFGSNQTVQFFTDTGKGQLYQDSVPIRALDVIPLPGSDHREDILLVRTPENTIKLYSYDGYGRLFKETYFCAEDDCSLGENLLNGATALANGTKTIFIAPSQVNEDYATFLVIQSVVEDYPSPLFERTRQLYNDFQRLTELYKRFQKTVMETTGALDDAIDRTGSNVVTGNWTVNSVRSHKVIIPGTNHTPHEKATFEANFGTIEFNDAPLKYEDFFINDAPPLGHLQNLLLEIQAEADRTVPLDSPEAIQISSPQVIKANVHASFIGARQLHVSSINDVDRPDFFYGLGTYDSPSGIRANRTILFHGTLKATDIRPNRVNGVPTKYMAFSSADNVFNNSIALNSKTVMFDNLTASTVAGLRIPEDIILASNVTGVNAKGTIIATEAKIESPVGGIQINGSLRDLIVSNDAVQSISSHITLENFVLRHTSSIKYLNGWDLRRLIPSIVLKNHQGLIRGKKTIAYRDVPSKKVNIYETLNSVPFPDGFFHKGEDNLVLNGVKSFANLQADKIILDGYLDGARPDQIVTLDSSKHSNNEASWTLHGHANFTGDIHVTEDISGIKTSQWEHEDPSTFKDHYLYFPNRHIVIENPVVVEKLTAERYINRELYNRTFGNVLNCHQGQPMTIKGLTTFPGGVKLGEVEFQTNAVGDASLDSFLSRRKEQNITKNFLFQKPVQFLELSLLKTVDGVLLESALEGVIHEESIHWPPGLAFESIHAKSDVSLSGRVNNNKNFGSDLAVTRGRENQEFDGVLHVKFLKVENLNTDALNTAGDINGLNIDKWEKERVSLSKDRTWPHPVEITGKTNIAKNIPLKTINGESVQFLKDGVLRKDAGLQTFTSPVVINGQIFVKGKVRVHNSLNGYSLDHIVTDSIALDSVDPEKVTDTLKFENAVFEKLTVRGKTCGVDLGHLEADSVKKNAPSVHFQGRTAFSENIEASQKLRTNFLNSKDVNTTYFTLHTDQDVRGEFMAKKDVHVQGQFNVFGKVDNISLQELRHHYSLHLDTHHINDSVKFKSSFEAKHLKVDGMIQSRDFSRFLSSLVKQHSPELQTVHGDLDFKQPIISEGNIQCDTLNGIDVSELVEQLVLKHAGYVFKSRTCFTKPTQVGTLLVESGNVETTTGKVGDVNIEELKENSVPINSPNPLSMETLAFEGLSIKGSLEGVRYINGIPIDEFLTKNRPQSMTSLKVANLTLLQKDINAEHLFGSVNIREAFEDTVLVTRAGGFVNGAKSFTGTVKILGNLRTDESLTGSLVMMNGANVITSSTVFNDPVRVSGDMSLSGKWNNFSLSEMQEHGISKYGDEVIKGRWNFPRGLVLANSSQTYGLIDGINMTNFDRESRQKVHEVEEALSPDREEFNEICHTYHRLFAETERSALKLQSFDEQQVIFAKQKVTNMLTVEAGTSLFLLVASDACGVFVYKWSTQKEEFHEFGLALAEESIDKWVRSSLTTSVIIVFSSAPSNCQRQTENGLYFTIADADGNFADKSLINSGAVVDFKLVNDNVDGILLFVVYQETPETIDVYSWNNTNYIFDLEASLNSSSFIRTLDVNKLRNGDVEILLQTVRQVSLVVYTSRHKSLKEIGHADFYGSTKSTALFRADNSLYALVPSRTTSKTAIKPDTSLQLFLAIRGDLQFLQKLTVYDLVSMEVVRLGDQVYVLVLTKPVGLYVYKFMGLSGLQSVNIHPLKFHHGEHLASFAVTPWHYDIPVPFVLISNGKMIKLFHSKVVGNAVIGSDEKNPQNICHSHNSRP